DYVALRATRSDVTAAFLCMEGAHPLDRSPENLDEFVAAGFRMIGIAHFFDNAFGGSAHGVAKSGLTDAGRALVKRMEQQHIIVDLAHSSPAVIDDVLQ